MNEPLHGHALSVVRRSKQMVHSFLVSAGRGIGEKVVQFLEARRNAGEVKGDPLQQVGFIGFGRRLHALSFQAAQNKIVDCIARPGA
jgi:hypothetical protein